MGFRDIGTSFIESFMQDSCVIHRPVDPAYLPIDEETGELLEGGSEPIYEGVCLVQSLSTRDLSFEEADDAKFRKMYDVLLPKSTTPELRYGDMITFVSSELDPTLTGKTFRLSEVRHNTQSVYRYTRAEDIRQDYNHTNPAF